MNVDLGLLAQYGAIGVMLIVFIILHFRALKSAEARETTMATQLVANRQECRDDTQKLVTRIQSLEDRQYEDTVSIAKTCADALKMNAEAYRKYSEAETQRIRKKS